MQSTFFATSHLKHFLENYWFCRKSGKDAYSKALDGHVIYVIMTHCEQKLMCDSRLKWAKNNLFTWIDLYVVCVGFKYHISSEITKEWSAFENYYRTQPVLTCSKLTIETIEQGWEVSLFLTSRNTVRAQNN